jgi:hypothetical protein
MREGYVLGTAPWNRPETYGDANLPRDTPHCFSYGDKRDYL